MWYDSPGVVMDSTEILLVSINITHYYCFSASHPGVDSRLGHGRSNMQLIMPFIRPLSLKPSTTIAETSHRCEALDAYRIRIPSDKSTYCLGNRSPPLLCYLSQGSAFRWCILPTDLCFRIRRTTRFPTSVDDQITKFAKRQQPSNEPLRMASSPLSPPISTCHWSDGTRRLARWCSSNDGSGYSKTRPLMQRVLENLGALSVSTSMLEESSDDGVYALYFVFSTKGGQGRCLPLSCCRRRIQ